MAVGGGWRSSPFVSEVVGARLRSYMAVGAGGPWSELVGDRGERSSPFVDGGDGRSRSVLVDGGGRSLRFEVVVVGASPWAVLGARCRSRVVLVVVGVECGGG